MSIAQAFSFITSYLLDFIVGIFSFIKSLVSLPVYLTGLFINLPPVFSLGLNITFTLIVGCLIFKIFHMLKG